MQEKVMQTIEKYKMISKEDKILVAVSGGPDSISLLNILYELKYNIGVAHINHGLRDNANIDEDFVRSFCENRNIPCFIKKVNLKEELNGMTIEEAGRKVRYDFFYEIMREEGYTKIATAHNSNDNAETVIMNLIRGSGVTGLKGITPVQNNIIRPLIEISRKEIEAYCDFNNLNPRHDESNDDDNFTRNKIRLRIIPYIENNINLGVVNNINRLSNIVLEQEEFINEETEKSYNDLLIDEEDNKIILNLKKFNNLNVVLRKKIILKSIIKILGNAKDIEKIHIDDIIKLCENNIGGKFLMPNKNIKITVIKGRVEFLGIS